MLPPGSTAAPVGRTKPEAMVCSLLPSRLMRIRRQLGLAGTSTYPAEGVRDGIGVVGDVEIGGQGTRVAGGVSVGGEVGAGGLASGVGEPVAAERCVKVEVVVASD